MAMLITIACIESWQLVEHAGEHVIELLTRVTDWMFSASSVHRYHYQQPAAAAAAARY